MNPDQIDPEILKAAIKLIKLRKNPKKCVDCKTESYEWYMLRDEVWKQAGLKFSENCCIDCLKKRLGGHIKKSYLDPKANMNRMALVIEDDL